jgi:flagellar motor switch/type III secretory pathway protein FliN
VLDLLVQEMLEDLCRLIEPKLGEAETQSPSNLRACIGLGRGEVLDLRLPSPALVPLLKAKWPRAMSSSGALRRRSDALKQVSVSARACLGRVEIALEELEGLSVGDVLVLDRNVNDPIDLCLPGSDQPVLRGALRRDADRIVLQL